MLGKRTKRLHEKGLSGRNKRRFIRNLGKESSIIDNGFAKNEKDLLAMTKFTMNTHNRYGYVNWNHQSGFRVK